MIEPLSLWIEPRRLDSSIIIASSRSQILGTTFDWICQKKQNVEKWRSDFSQCRDAIQAVVDFIQNASQSPPTSVITLLNQIKDNEIVLPC